MEKRITALKAQKRNTNRINVYLDGEFAFGLARIVAAWLQIGQILTEEKIADLQRQDTHEVAYQRALNLLSYRPRAAAEIERRLVEAGYEPATIDLVLDRLRRSGLVMDEQFARTWIENRSEFRPRGRRLLAAELRQKGVSDEVITQALEDMTDESSLAYQAAKRYARRLAGLEWLRFRERLGAFLARRGFSYETSLPAVRRVWEELQSASEGTPDYDEGLDE